MAKSVDSRDQKVGQGQSFDLPASGPVGTLAEEIETVDTPRWKDKAKMTAFMEEPVQVMIADTGQPNEEQYVELGCNGIKQFVVRGQWQTIKRKFVESLARAKTDKVTTPEYTDAAGNRATKIVLTPALMYPFQVRDKNPDGAVWLQRVLAER